MRGLDALSIEGPQPARTGPPQFLGSAALSLHQLRLAGLAAATAVRQRKQQRVGGDARPRCARFPAAGRGVSAATNVFAPGPALNRTEPSLAVCIRHPTERGASLAVALLLLAIAWGALAFGAVYPWAYWPLAAACLIAGAIGTAAGSSRIAPGSRALAIALIVLGASIA